MPRLSWVIGIGIGIGVTACRAAEPSDAVTPSLVLDVASDTVEAAQGSVLLIGANLLRNASYSDSVTLRIEGVPDGMRAQASGLMTADQITSALLAIAVDPSVPDASYPLTVRAIAAGLPDMTVPLTVIVEPSNALVYTLDARPVSVVQGDSTTDLLDINRANFRDSLVQLSVENLPAGVTVSLSPVANPRASTVMIARADPHALPGRYMLRVRGSTAVLGDRVARVPLTITAAVTAVAPLANRDRRSYR